MVKIVIKFHNKTKPSEMEKVWKKISKIAYEEPSVMSIDMNN